MVFLILQEKITLMSEYNIHIRHTNNSMLPLTNITPLWMLVLKLSSHQQLFVLHGCTLDFNHWNQHSFDTKISSVVQSTTLNITPFNISVKWMSWL